MIRKMLTGSIVAMALATPVWAQQQCALPTAPAIPDGAKATSAQIVTAQNDIKAFAAASDAYQVCVAHEIVRQRDLAKQSNVEFDPGVQGALQAKADAQRNDAGRLATAWGATVQAFNDAQAKKKRPADVRAPAAAASGGYRY